MKKPYPIIRLGRKVRVFVFYFIRTAHDRRRAYENSVVATAGGRDVHRILYESAAAAYWLEWKKKKSGTYLRRRAHLVINTVIIRSPSMLRVSVPAGQATQQLPLHAQQRPATQPSSAVNGFFFFVCC